MTYTIRTASPRPARFTRRGRPGGAAAIQQIQIHATRGSVPMDLQVSATEHHFAGQRDRGGWGASADLVVGPDRRAGGEIVIVKFGDWRRTFGSWSAGFGPNGAATEYGAAEVAVAIEVAQPARRLSSGRYVPGDSDVPYTPETLDALAWLCAQINDELEDAGGSRVPRVHIAHWNQRRAAVVPRGYIGHDELANGVRLGKTDPGAMFPWPQFLAAVGEYESGSEPVGLPPAYYDAAGRLSDAITAGESAHKRARIAAVEMAGQVPAEGGQ